MDFLSLLRTLGALGVVLGLLAGALWAVRRYDIKLPGGMIGGLIGAGTGTRRIELVERLPIDARRSVALIRRDNKEHLVMIAPEGLLMLEAAIASKPATKAKPHA
ncbi:flagellar biosynthetic protein FliO [Sphingomonas sp. LaA6.9]|uniref:flagellar biosynthetic protein FliO n=1 Tax=Sphingomonas sp. LaA6.9 TaxID=2919914 RepID=UPI001F500C57|nr:flagellar biosynthetic protein FliO [Sphingomonas sp. LaA6.9]MCJ8158672.1 flagellar biosynthetic protein FliO [Sphingomonas sp. LaA6.9]